MWSGERIGGHWNCRFHVVNSRHRPTLPPRLGIDKSERSAKLDAIIALSMALDRAEQRPEPVWLVGWLEPDYPKPATLDPATHAGVCSPCILHQEGREGKDNK